MRVASFALIAVLTLSASDAFAADMEKVYAKKCDNCHGKDGTGQTKLGRKYKSPDFTQAAWQAKHDDQEIKDAIVKGVPKTKMKPFKRKLSPAELDGLVKIVRAFKK